MAKLETGTRNSMEKSAFAFPKERKEPLENASHVRNAIARFNQVKGVSAEERGAAWKRIKAAAKKYDVAIAEKSWSVRRIAVVKLVARCLLLVEASIRVVSG